MSYWISQGSREMCQREGKGRRGLKSTDKDSAQLGIKGVKYQ